MCVRGWAEALGYMPALLTELSWRLSPRQPSRSALRERHAAAAVVRLQQQAEALRAGQAEHRGAARRLSGFGRGNGVDGPGSEGDEAREDQSSHDVPPG